MKVQGMMPITSKRRIVDKETGQTVEGTSLLVPRSSPAKPSILFADWDIVFADDEREANPTTFKFLQMAHAWKAMQAKGAGASTNVLSGFAAAAAASASAKETAEAEASGVREGSRPDRARADDDAISDVASSNGDEDD